MDDEGKREAEKIAAINQNPISGRANRGGAAFNILSLQYEQNADGEMLREHDHDLQVRNLLRSKHVDMRGNSGYNIVNGTERHSIDLPLHRVYNPPDTLKSVGERILGSGFAGKPVRKELFESPKPSSQQS